VPDATWLPLVVDTDLWHGEVAPMSSGRPPVVLHCPNKPALKGSDAVDEVCNELQALGLIRYVREESLTPEQMRTLVEGADIVVDQLRLGDYGVTAIEALSAGRVVVGHVAERVRGRIPGDLPIVEAVAGT